MKSDGFTPGEIREMLNLSRSALRYYIHKGLLDVDKSDENGYHTFTQNNLSDLRNISYLRHTLDFSINDIQDCLNAATPDDYEAVFVKKKAMLESEIAQKKIQLDHLSKWENYLNHLKNSPTSIGIVEFSSPFVFSPTISLSLDKLPLLCSSFQLENGAPVFNGYGYCFDAPSEYNLEESDIKYCFPGGKYIYAMYSSELGMDDPGILTSTLNGSQKHGHQIRGPIQVDYFFRIEENGAYRHFYAITIPFADCDIKING